MPVAGALDEPGGDQHVHLPRDAGHGLAQLHREVLDASPAGRRRARRSGAGWCRRAPGGPRAGLGPRRQCRWRRLAAPVRFAPMLADGRRIGAHLPLGAGMVRAADRAAEIGAAAIQVFTDNPTAWRRRPTLPDELPAFRERLAARDIRPDRDPCPVSRQPRRAGAGVPRRSPSRCWPTSCASRQRAARRSSTSTSGPIAAPASSAGIARLGRRASRRVLDEVGTATARASSLVLENGVRRRLRDGHPRSRAGRDRRRAGRARASARSGSASASTPRTCGAPATRSTSRRASMRCWTSSTRRSASTGSRMVHLNDSRSELGSRSDRHEHLGAGRIGARGLGRLLTHPGARARRVPSSRRRAWTRATTSSTWTGRATSRRAGRSPTCRPRRSSRGARGAGARRRSRTPTPRAARA